MKEPLTTRQAAKRLGVSYGRLYHALVRYDGARHARYEHRIVTIRQCEEALAQVRPTGQRQETVSI
jgi:hypothetical protein